MATLSLLEKILILLELSKSSLIFLAALVVIIFFGLILATTNKINVKATRRLFILFYIFIAVAIYVLYKDSLKTLVDYFMNNVFNIIFFPNLAIYFFAIVVTNIIIWFSVFNFKTNRIVKNINIVVYLVMNYLLVILLSIILDNNLDVFNISSIYSNRSAQAIIELSSTLFILWILFLIIYKAIRTYQTKDLKLVPKKPKKEIVEEPVIIKSIPVNYTEKSIRTIPKNYSFDNLLTVNDYKQVLNILKEKQEIDEQEKIKKEKKEKELSKFRELEELYGVR